MEIQKENPDLKTKPEKEEDQVNEFMIAWRNSKYYKFVIKILDEELEMQYLKEAMENAYLNGKPLSNDEIADTARGEAFSNLRIKKIKDTLA